MKHQWTCGHTAEAMCGECYRELAAVSNRLAEEIERLKEIVDGVLEEVRGIEPGGQEPKDG